MFYWCNQASNARQYMCWPLCFPWLNIAIFVLFFQNAESWYSAGNVLFLLFFFLVMNYNALRICNYGEINPLNEDCETQLKGSRLDMDVQMLSNILLILISKPPLVHKLQSLQYIMFWKLQSHAVRIKSADLWMTEWLWPPHPTERWGRAAELKMVEGMV